MVNIGTECCVLGSCIISNYNRSINYVNFFFNGSIKRFFVYANCSQLEDYTPPPEWIGQLSGISYKIMQNSKNTK